MIGAVGWPHMEVTAQVPSMSPPHPETSHAPAPPALLASPPHPVRQTEKASEHASVLSIFPADLTRARSLLQDEPCARSSGFVERIYVSPTTWRSIWAAAAAAAAARRRATS